MLRKIIDWFIPPRCVRCGDSLLEAYKLCASCWEKVDFISEPFCYICGYPLSIENQIQSTCEACLTCKPVYETARSVVIYRGEAKKLILRFKHADAIELGALFARWLYQQQRDYITEVDYIVSVPLHWTRLLRRRYNQAAIISLHLKKLSSDLPVYVPQFLRRIKKTESQGHKNIDDRKQNINKAFLVPARYHEKLQGRTVLLIDDVMTSGATVEECSQALYEAGCATVKVLTLARVLSKNEIL